MTTIESASETASRHPGVRFMAGGHTRFAVYATPGVLYSGYDTVACGRASDIECRVGEVVVRTGAGDEYSFSRYVAAPAATLAAYLRDRAGVYAAAFAGTPSADGWREWSDRLLRIAARVEEIAGGALCDQAAYEAYVAAREAAYEARRAEEARQMEAYRVAEERRLALIRRARELGENPRLGRRGRAELAGVRAQLRALGGAS